MVQLVKSNNKKGFSLIELMIALFIITVAVLGLLTLTITSIQTNMQNDIRNTATRLTSQTAEILLARPIDTISTCGITLDSTITTGSVAVYNSAYTYNTSNNCLVDSNAAEDYKKYPNASQPLGGSSGTKEYNITWTVSNLTNDLRQITIRVSYKYRDQTYTNEAVIYKHRSV